MKTSKDKYYTPDISEFYVGFECEFKNNMQSNQWETEEVDVDLMQIAIDNFEYEEYEGEFADTFRVKCLHKEDIESLGFEKVKEEDKRWTWGAEYIKEISKDSVLTLTLTSNSCRIAIANKYDWERHNELYFTIKNKSELIKIIKQLNLDEI